MLSYAQNFEDVMLERLFREVSAGHYVDIGAWDPSVHSVTRHFYDRGWRGLNVEPIPERCQRFQAERPRDTNLCIAVGGKPGSATFYHCLEESYLSTLDGEGAADLRARGLTITEQKIDVLTPNELFETYCHENVDFLKIDIEGLEGELLRAFDLNRYRPRAIIVEATRPSIAPSSIESFEEIGTWENWEPHVLAHRYRLAHFDGLNRFYLREEDASLARRLVLPPCIFDDFQLAPVVAEIGGLRQDRALQHDTIERLVGELQSVSSDRNAKAQIVDRLVTEVTVLSADRAAKADVVDRLMGEVESGRAARAELRDRLTAKINALNLKLIGQAKTIKRVTDQNSTLIDKHSTQACMIERLSAERQALGTKLEAQGKDLLRFQAESQSWTIKHDKLKQDLINAEGIAASLRLEIADQLDAKRKTQLRMDEQSRRIVGKNEALAHLSTQLVDMRSTLGGATEIAFRWRRVPGQNNGGGRYVGSFRCDSGTDRRIGIDVMAIQFGISGGVEVYMRTLVRSLLTTRSTGVILICLSGQVEQLRRWFGDDVSYYIFSIRPLTRLAKRFQARLNKELFTETIDHVPSSFARLREEAGVQILHCPVQCYSLFDFNVPALFHLHDLQHLHFPDNFRPSDIEARNRFYGLSADLSEFIIATSNYVRDDIVARMGVPTDKVRVIPATWDPAVSEGVQFFGPDDARRHYSLPKLYALYPAQFWPHKNHVRLVEALSIVLNAMPGVDFNLVFTGNRMHSGWPVVANAIERLKLGDRIRCLDYVPTEHLGGLYKAASFCVMPSTFEASSYPVIEAQLFGCPAMCSNVTSLPELVQGGAGLLFDPFDSQDIADQMLRWLRDPEDAAKYAEKASEKVQRDHGMESYITALNRIYDDITNRSGFAGSLITQTIRS